MSEHDPLRVWRELRTLVIDGLDGFRQQVVEATGLPFSRVQALRRLRSGPLTPTALAEAMMVDRPAASVAVDDLCTRGLVVRQVHPSDRRRKLVSLTPEGRRMVERIEAVVPPPPPGWTRLPAEELAVVARVTRRLTPPAGRP